MSKDCLDPPISDNGKWTTSNTKSGTVTKLTCNDGYSIQGSNSTMKCGEGGMWEFDGPFPECKSGSITEEWIDDTDFLASPCRNSSNLLSFYMTELNGINVIIKLIIIGLYYKTYKKKNKLIQGLIILLLIHTCIHILIIIASLPPFCDSSNPEWHMLDTPDTPDKGDFFNFKKCHMKYELYYSMPFWFIDTIVPGILAIGLLYK